MPDDAIIAASRRRAAALARKRRVSLGPPLALDDVTLTALSEVGPHDIPAAEAFVRDAAGQRGVDMLRARRV